MKLTPWFLAALAPIAIAGCSGTLLGHVAVLAVTLGIFVGTLSLGRVAQSNSSQTTAQIVAPIVTPIATPASHDAGDTLS